MAAAPRTPVQAPRQIQAPHIVRTAPTARHFNRDRQNNQFARGRRGSINCTNGFASVPLFNAYPSYGFNFAYQNAINGDLALKAAIDPATQWQLAEAQRFGCETFTGGGYYLLGGYDYPYPAAPEAEQPEGAAPPAQPQVIVLQQPATQPASRADAEAPQESAAPVRDEGQFVLVLRDGSRVEALAFMRSKDGVTYITTEGTRRSIALADLDSGATVRVNEERGTPLKLPL